MNRRGFFKLPAGVALGASIGIPIAEAKSTAIEVPKPPPSEGTHIVLQGYKNREKPQQLSANSGIGYFTTVEPSEHKVAMAVGEDGRLWIKIGDEWKRVAVE